MSLSLRIPDDQPSPLRRLPKHLIPFLPYLDRPDTSHAIEERIPAGKHALRLSTMAFWLRACARSHGDHCVPPPRSGAARPLWLIDVRAYCLVAVKDDGEEENSSVSLYPYVALSYVWGQASSATATLANIAALQSPGALDGQDIPATIWEAMELTRLLGERYLWVDRLCIVQDDKDAKPAQLLGMADIYGGATLTIVAAQGRGADEPLHHGLVDETEEEGAESGQGALPCLEEVTLEEWAQQVDAHRAVMEAHARDLVNTAWCQRGWTFQELMFSRRQLVFHNDTVNW
ncbi:heterokaryon incompatibility protein-domain-containing protein, partial [Colletotrichum lupini]